MKLVITRLVYFSVSRSDHVEGKTIGSGISSNDPNSTKVILSNWFIVFDRIVRTDIGTVVILMQDKYGILMAESGMVGNLANGLAFKWHLNTRQFTMYLNTRHQGSSLWIIYLFQVWFSSNISKTRPCVLYVVCIEIVNL